jgi:hypothetical protein
MHLTLYHVAILPHPNHKLSPNFRRKSHQPADHLTILPTIGSIPRPELWPADPKATWKNGRNQFTQGFAGPANPLKSRSEVATYSPLTPDRGGQSAETNKQQKDNTYMNTDTELLSCDEMDAIVEAQCNVDPSELPAAIDALNLDQLHVLHEMCVESIQRQTRILHLVELRLVGNL